MLRQKRHRLDAVDRERTSMTRYGVDREPERHIGTSDPPTLECCGLDAMMTSGVRRPSDWMKENFFACRRQSRSRRWAIAGSTRSHAAEGGNRSMTASKRLRLTCRWETRLR